MPSIVVAIWLLLGAFISPLPPAIAENSVAMLKPLHKMSEAQIRREMSVLPLIWERTSERLPMQHVVVFRKSTTGE